MKIIETDINSLIPYEFNNKVHDEDQINKIANSIKEFWFTQPIVIDKNNVVIIGHWRLESAKKLWLKKVPCVILDELTDKQIQKLRILDNKLNESEYDLANLKMELDSLWDLNFWDLKLTVHDLFPEFDVPEFDPDEFEWKEKEKKLSVTVYVDDEEQLETLKNDLSDLWKLEFFQSDFDDVKSFLNTKWMLWKVSSRWTNWWAKEKQDFKQKITQKALENALKKQAKELEIPMDQLSKAKKNAVIKAINVMMEDKLSMADSERIIRILRTEMWLPNTYSRNENINEERQELNQDDKDLIDEYFKEKKWK